MTGFIGDFTFIILPTSRIQPIGVVAMLEIPSNPILVEVPSDDLSDIVSGSINICRKRKILLAIIHHCYQMVNQGFKRGLIYRGFPLYASVPYLHSPFPEVRLKGQDAQISEAIYRSILVYGS